MKCGICGNSNLVARFGLNNQQVIYKCLSCTTVQLLPQRVSLDDYNEDYYAYYGRNLQSDTALEVIKLKTYCRLIRVVESYVKVGRMLDIGCGLGHCLKAAQLLGWEAIGIEYSKEGAQIAQRYSGARVFCTKLKKTTFKPESFQAVMMFDVIEHVDNPKELLGRVSKILSPGGILLIVTPNVSSISAKVMGRKWNHYHSDHLFYFDRNSIKSVFPKDLRIVKIESTLKFFNLAYVKGYFGRYPTPFFTTATSVLYALMPQALREFPISVHSGSMMLLAQKETYSA